MRDQTVAALDRLNRDFYEAHGGRFDQTRMAPWSGWSSLAALEATGDGGGSRLRVADLGCGNGRFATFLASTVGPLSYLGLERSWVLARTCRARLSSDVALGTKTHHLVAVADLLADQQWLRPRSFDLVVCFGVLHHVPSRKRRRLLIERSFDLVRDGGWLVLTFWQFLDEPSIAKRCIDSRGALESELLPADVAADLEGTDRLLPWGDPGKEGPARASSRYCHHTTDDEAKSLVDGLASSEQRLWRSDGRTGRLNLYVELRRSTRS